VPGKDLKLSISYYEGASRPSLQYSYVGGVPSIRWLCSHPLFVPGYFRTPNASPLRGSFLTPAIGTTVPVGSESSLTFCIVAGRRALCPPVQIRER
jgi:hypothetical protein